MSEKSCVCVIGGAGYIGSVVVEALLTADRKVCVYDNLSLGHRSAVPEGAIFVQGDHGDETLLKETLQKYNCSSVMHFSALSLVGESVEKPLLYYENNVAKGVALLRAVLAAGVRYFIFSSTAAVYGEPVQVRLSSPGCAIQVRLSRPGCAISVPILEDAPTFPTNPYGNTKLAFERLLADTAMVNNLRFVSLRYFNAAGATERCGEDHNPETHLIPLVLQAAAGRRNAICVYGNDYPTPDGTCIRDYIHVQDLAEAHLLALKYLEGGGAPDVFNLGNGQGFSVLEVIEVARRVTGREIAVQVAGRRSGDPAILVASSEKIQKVLNWKPQHSHLEDIIESAWKWHQAHPQGYKR
jgi:UDP-glucose 4-epimerase